MLKNIYISRSIILTMGLLLYGFQGVASDLEIGLEPKYRPAYPALRASSPDFILHPDDDPHYLRLWLNYFTWYGLHLYSGNRNWPGKSFNFSILEKGRRSAGRICYFASTNATGSVMGDIRVMRFADDKAWAYIQIAGFDTNSPLTMVALEFRATGRSPNPGRMFSTRARDLTIPDGNRGGPRHDLQADELDAISVWSTEACQFASPLSGALAVIDTNPVEKASISYAYAPWVPLYLKPGTQTIRFAISGYRGQNALAARQRFFAEDSRRVQARLFSIDFNRFAGNGYDFDQADQRLAAMLPLLSDPDRAEAGRMQEAIRASGVLSNSVGSADWASMVYALEEQCRKTLLTLGQLLTTNTVKTMANLPAPDYSFTPTIYPCPKVKQPPVLDGKLDDPCWQKCSAVPFGSQMYTLNPPHNRSEIRMCYDDTHWYIALELFDAHMQTIKAVIPKGEGYQELWKDDCVEIHVTPPHLGRTKWVINPNGALVELYGMLAGARAETRREADRWIIETSVCWSGYGVAAPAGQRWSMNVLRYMWGTGRFQSDTLAPGMSEAVHWGDGVVWFVPAEQTADTVTSAKVGQPDLILLNQAKAMIAGHQALLTQTNTIGLAGVIQQMDNAVKDLEIQGRPGPFYKEKADLLKDLLFQVEDVAWKEHVSTFIRQVNGRP